jgi:hypothetical protein
MIAPRKLQSLGAAVQAVAAAVSSVRSTENAVAKGGIRLDIRGIARETVICLLVELEDTLSVDFKNAPTKTTSVNSNQATFLFIV